MDRSYLLSPLRGLRVMFSVFCGLTPAAICCRRFATESEASKQILRISRWLGSLGLGVALFMIATAATAADEPFRPEAGRFPPLEKSHSFRGELVFVDHANRRGSIRVQGTGKFYRNDPQPFAMLPYGVIWYHGAPADLRDIPLGTVMHVRAFLPPDPKISAVPVLPVDNKKKDAGHYRGTGTAPAENHVLLLEDEPSHCLRKGMLWQLKEVELNDNAGKIIACREPKADGTINGATALCRVV